MQLDKKNIEITSFWICNVFPRFCFIACFQQSVFVPNKLLATNYPLFHCQFSSFLLDVMFSSDIHRAEKECPGNFITFS